MCLADDECPGSAVNEHGVSHVGEEVLEGLGALSYTSMSTSPSFGGTLLAPFALLWLVESPFRACHEDVP